MEEAGTYTSLRYSIKRFEGECSKVLTAIRDMNGEVMHDPENDLDTTLERLHEEADKQIRGLLEAVKAKKPSERTGLNDQSYMMYKVLLQEITKAVHKTTDMFTSIFKKIEELISVKIGKKKKKFVDIDHYLVSYIIDELCDLFTRIFIKHRLFIHDIWQALNQSKPYVPIGNKLEGDMKEILQRWVRHFEMTGEKLKITNS